MSRIVEFSLGGRCIRLFAGSYIIALPSLSRFVMQTFSSSFCFFKMSVVIISDEGNIRLILRLRVRNGGIVEGPYFVLHSFYLLVGFGGSVFFRTDQHTLLT